MKHRLYWTPEKIAARLALIRPLVYRWRRAIPAFRYQALCGPEADPWQDGGADWQTIEAGSYWGAWTTDFVMESHFAVPGDWDGGPVSLHLPLGAAGDIFNHPEALLYVDGAAYGSVDRYHHEIRLPPTVCDGERHELALHGWTGLSGWPPNPESRDRLLMGTCAVVEVDEATEALVTTAQMALEVAAALADDRTEKHGILNALDAAFGVLDTRDPIGGPAFYDSAPAALAALREGLAQAGSATDVSMIAVGHAHIDVAYLWRVAQTRHKAGRTFSNAVRLLSAFPDYRFSQSQAQLYAFVEADHPDLFADIKARVADGQWEVMGGMWVECDCNIAGAEALVRQLLLGRSYFRERFGDVETPVLWLPDSFGFCWSLPQLMVQAGLKWFATNKVTWNQYNPMPAQLTWWQGLDGTRVLAHFLTTPRETEYLPFPATYKAEVTAAEVMGSWDAFRQKSAHRELLMAYGYGDGGGGPTRELIGRARVLADMPGAPRVRMGTVRSFFEGVEAAGTADLPVWNDEIYMEGHRGVLTSEARIKHHNRKGEVLLHDAEFLATLAHLSGAAYPHDELKRAWTLLCLNQFHDVLPGTSIPEVFEDAERDYKAVGEIADKIIDDAVAVIGAGLPEGARAVAINPAPFGGPKLGVLAGWSGGLADARSGEALPVQTVEDGVLVALPSVPAYGVVALTDGDAMAPATGLSVAATGESGVLENDLIRVEVGGDGALTRVFDKEVGREVLPAGALGNQLQVFEDRPIQWDAWDIDAFFEDSIELVNGSAALEVVEQGPLRAALAVTRAFRGSRIRQVVRLCLDSKRIDFETEIDWQETHFLLKVAFPVDVLNPTATYDIQWGNIARPTHRNTSWDFAKFEVAAQKWADLSEGDYGVTVLNDCKYGYDIKDNVIRLSLIKSGTMPNPAGDRGRHRMTYSLLPHKGDWRHGVPAAAYDLNDPVRIVAAEGAGGPAAAGMVVEADRRNVVIETVKVAEDGNGVIVRLYEGERCRGAATLRFGFPVARVFRCNLLEEGEEAIAVADNAVVVALRPYEIVTLRCVPAA